MKTKMIAIKSLVMDKYNPRQMSAKQFKDLKASLVEFGFVQPVVINTHKGRENVVIGGHQRIRVWVDLGNDKVPCLEIDLSKKKERELNIRLNKNTGQWDYDLLSNNFDIDELVEWGFKEADLLEFMQDDFQDEFYQADDSNAEMPIVPKFSETYSSVVIFCDNDLDENWLENVLGISKAKCYKSSRVMPCKVITVSQLQKKWEER
jgi:hypothetical protein